MDEHFHKSIRLNSEWSESKEKLETATKDYKASLAWRDENIELVALQGEQFQM